MSVYDIITCHQLSSSVNICHDLSSCVCHSDFAAQISIEMPFDIKTVESPTHKIKMKVFADLNTTLIYCVRTINKQ